MGLSASAELVTLDVICSFQLRCLYRGFWWVTFSTAKIHCQSSAFILLFLFVTVQSLMTKAPFYYKQDS